MALPAGGCAPASSGSAAKALWTAAMADKAKTTETINCLKGIPALRWVSRGQFDRKNRRQHSLLAEAVQWNRGRSGGYRARVRAQARPGKGGNRGASSLVSAPDYGLPERRPGPERRNKEKVYVP